MKKKKYVIATVIILLLCAVGAGIGLTATANIDDNVICNGVYIDSINLSGMTESEAKKALESYVNELKSKKLTVKVDDKTVSTTFEKLGYDVVQNDYIEQALKVGKSGNIIKRYKDLKDIEKEKLVYHLEFKVEDDIVKNLVEKDCSSFNIPSKNAGLKRKNGTFIVSNHKVGRKVVVDETIEKIKNAMLNDWNKQDLTVDAIVIDDEPKFTKEIVSKCNTIIGKYTTSFATSTEARAANVANGAKLLNGTVLYPDEQLSCYDKLNPFTMENGYYTAGAYQQGLVVDSIGGGICQVSSTLYNASILAELEIVQRQPHSMAVSYVPLSRDAAIAGTYKDLKIKNNTDAPIYIEAYTSGRTITFNIYGAETRDSGRTIKYETVVKKEIAPPEDVVTEDNTKPSSYKEITQTEHIGYKAELYKIIYQDGKEISRTLFNSSSYEAAPKYITIGTKDSGNDIDKNKETDNESKNDTNEDSKKDTKTDSKTDNTKTDKVVKTNKLEDKSKTDTSNKSNDQTTDKSTDNTTNNTPEPQVEETN